MSRSLRAAAVLAASALALSTGAGVAGAQSEGPGTLSSDVTGSVTGGQFPPVGSTQQGAEVVSPGSIDTSGSALIGEPTFGSLAPVVSEGVGSVNDAAGSNAVNPAPGTGLVDTSGSLLGEPTTGSLAPVWGSVGGVVGDALGSDEGPAVVIGSGGGSDSLGGSGSLGPLLLVGGSAAVVGAGVYFAPQISQALTDAGVVIPPEVHQALTGVGIALPPLPEA